MPTDYANSRTNLGGPQRELLSRKISELSLIIQGTRLEALVEQLYAELDHAGVALRPQTYLADEWGCPDGVPAIGIPFYLALPELRQLEGELTDVEAEGEDEILMLLRHEAGHAFNYAYRLYDEPMWAEIFGSFAQAYDDDYTPVPFSARFVHHLAGWYAQKHPDEDFAETFAVWLTPGSDWRARYADTPALRKLLHVEELARRHGRAAPLVTDETRHMPVQEMTMTLDQWYGHSQHDYGDVPSFQGYLDKDLHVLFPAREGEDAANALMSVRRELIREVNTWTGVDPEFIRSLIERLIERARVLGLKIEPAQGAARAIRLAAFVTTLAMNYLNRGQLIER